VWALFDRDYPQSENRQSHSMIYPYWEASSLLIFVDDKYQTEFYRRGYLPLGKFRMPEEFLLKTGPHGWSTN